jgi:ArsR family transcriptional regulator, arsenate/arsenite/antimonite-responsive transcriptional repressor
MDRIKKSPLDATRFIVTLFPVTMNSAPSFFRALGDDTRWRIVRLVADRALCVCELADILGMPQSSVSSHVQIIRKAGLLESERCGKWTYFRIHTKHITLLTHLIETLPKDPSHKTDLKKAKARLKDRESSCCPGPIKLAETSCNSTN